MKVSSSAALTHTVSPANPPTAAELHSLLAEFAGQQPEAVARALVSLAPTRHVVQLASGSRLFTRTAR